MSSKSCPNCGTNTEFEDDADEPKICFECGGEMINPNFYRLDQKRFENG